VATEYLEALGTALDAHITTRLTAVSGFVIARFDVRADWGAAIPEDKSAIVIVVGDDEFTPHAPRVKTGTNLVRLGRWKAPLEVNIVVRESQRNQLGVIANHVHTALWGGSMYDGGLTVTLADYHNHKVRVLRRNTLRRMGNGSLAGRYVYTFECDAFGERLESRTIPSPTAYTLAGSVSPTETLT
jgi:hypothetical protein